MLIYVQLFIAAAALSFLLAYPVRAIALRLDIVDHPEKRKVHQIPIPLLGGLVIALSFCIVSAVGLYLQPDLLTGAVSSYAGLMAGGTIIVLLGLYDDICGAGPKLKFAVQTVAALVVVALGARVPLFTNPLGDSIQIGWLGIPIAILWIVGVTNAVNLIDGLDGLAAGVGAIAALGLFSVALPEKTFVAAMMAVLAGSLFGFLKHNFYPARMFLGDTGSMLIGFTLAVVGIHGSLKSTAATVLFLPIIVLGVPIFDTLFAIFRRARRRVSPFMPDREHIHHRLVRVGLHHRNVVLVLYFICAYLALTAYSISQFPYQTAFLFLALLMMGGIIAVRTLRFIEERLESRLAGEAPEAGSGGATPATRVSAPQLRVSGGGALRPIEGTTLLCEVGRMRSDFGSPAELEALRGEISAMLSRRVRVLSVIAERSGPGSILILLRTMPLTPPLNALIRDGIAWYLEEGRERFAGSEGFPSIEWLRNGPEAATGSPLTGSASTGDADPARTAALPEGRRNWARS